MKNIENILELKNIIGNKNIPIIPVKIKDILTESLAYDWELNKEQIRVLKERNKYINNILDNKKIKLFNINIEDKFIDIKKKTQQSNNNLLCLFLINYIYEYWSDIFGIWNKKIRPYIEEWNFTTKALLKNITNFLFHILNKKPFLRYNYTKGLLITNSLLNIIWIPGINLYYNDRKRVLRYIDYYIDFEKEVLLTIESWLNRIIAEGTSEYKIVNISQLRKIKWVKNPYIKPGTWWYWDDRKKYTFISNKI